MQKLIFILIFNSSITPAYNNNYMPIPTSPVLYYTLDNDEEKTTSSPCSAFSTSNGQMVTNFFNDKGHKAGFDELIKANIPGVGTEFATVFGINYQTGLPITLPKITTLSQNSVSINVNCPGILVTAIGHTHPDNVFPAPSAGDLYAFGNYAQSHPGFLYYILAADGSKYVLTVNNPGDLSRFLKLYPQKQNIAPDSLGNPGRGANYKYGSELYLSMQRVASIILSKSADPDNPTLTELDVAHEAVQAYILDHYKTGMALLKQDANGNFNEIHAVIDASNTRCGIVACN